MKDNSANKNNLFTWSWSKLRSITGASFSYLKNLFVSEERKDLHVVAGLTLTAAAAYYIIPENLVKKSKLLDNIFFSASKLFSATSAAKAIFTWGGNYYKEKTRLKYETKLAQVTKEKEGLSVSCTELQKDLNKSRAQQTSDQKINEVLKLEKQQKDNQITELRKQIKENRTKSNQSNKNSSQPIEEITILSTPKVTVLSIPANEDEKKQGTSLRF